MTSQRKGREPQTRGPPFGPLMQQLRPGLRERNARGGQKLAGLTSGELKICPADLGQLACQAQLMEAQRQIVACRQYRVHAVGKVRQQPGELAEGLRRVQLVEIIDHHHDVAASISELGEHPGDHRRRIEIWCRRRRRAAGRAADMTDRVEEGQPEFLGVVLVAPHLHDSEPVQLTWAVCPRAQQRRLPAASRSRDNRDLLRRRPVQRRKKITPVNQPEIRWCHVTSLPRSLRLPP